MINNILLIRYIASKEQQPAKSLKKRICDFLKNDFLIFSAFLLPRLYQGRTKAASASSLLPLRSHSASLRNGENTQKSAGRAEENTALALGWWCPGLFSLLWAHSGLS